MLNTSRMRKLWSPKIIMATFVEDCSDWIATPAPLNEKKSGKSAEFSGDNSVVMRQKPQGHEWGNCVCYTQYPLPLERVWQITVRDTTDWYGGLVSRRTALK